MRTLKRTIKAWLLAVPVVFAGAGAVFADVEPNDYLYQAEGPIGASVSGALSTPNDVDWYMLYLGSQTQFSLKATRTGGPSGCGIVDEELEVALRDTDGKTVTRLEVDDTVESTLSWTTPAGTQRFFLVVWSDCPSQSYRLTLDPAASLVSGPPMPVPQAYNPEPNEGSAQGVGPLNGDVTYSGSKDTENDTDWFWFYADAAFSLDVTGVPASISNPSFFCDLEVNLYAADGANPGPQVGGTDGLGVNLIEHVAVTPNGFTKYHVAVEDGCRGDNYQFRLTPASAIKVSAPPTAPGPVANLSLKAKKRSIRAVWAGPADATRYRASIRPKPRSGKSAVITTATTARFNGVRRGTKYRVCVTAANDVGSSVKVCRIVRTRR